MATSRISYYLFDEHQDKMTEGQFGRVYCASDTPMQGKMYALKLVQQSKLLKSF